MTKPSWTKVGESGALLLCERCGEEYRMALPCPVRVWVAAAKAFARDHADCVPAPEEGGE